MSDVIELLGFFGGDVRYWDDGEKRPVDGGREQIARWNSFVFRFANSHAKCDIQSFPFSPWETV